MKKVSLLVCVFILVLTSCSHDNPSPQVVEEQLTTNGTILKKAITTSGANVATEEYFYVGNKIQKIVSSNGTKFEFTYTGNLITKNDYFENNVLKSTDYYQYNTQEKMIQRKTLDFSNNHGYRCDFIYNTDGTVAIKAYSGNFTTQTTQIVDRKAFLFSNGDVEKIEEYVVVNGNPVTKTNSYTYDSKNATTNPILGYNKIKFWDSGTYGNSHNNTAILYATSENSTTSTNTISYTYNSFDYPMTANYLGITSQYFYQQP